MGCLNSNGRFSHWFANIHLSGPCNRACYFCIGQHMMALDRYNNLDVWPLKGLEEFTEHLIEKKISEVNLTGSNTDPLLYKHIISLKWYLLQKVSNLRFGIRTNGERFHHPDGRSDLHNFDKIAISLTSLDKRIYKSTMGIGEPPNIREILETYPNKDIKINIVLCPEILKGSMFSETDLCQTIRTLNQMGVTRINLREPYGQPHIGNPFFVKPSGPNVRLCSPGGSHLGMPIYWWVGNSETEIWYWDVHYVEVESVNLYANGVVSLTYPVTKGHDPVNGKVESQEQFTKSGRVRKQWLRYDNF